MLCYANLGPAVGIKALIRLLGWREGSFEFHAGLDPIETSQAPIALEQAILEAVEQLDELGRIDCARFAPEAKLDVRPSAAAGSEAPSKLEEAALELAQAGFTVGRILDVIPEPDLEIYRALISLADSGAIVLSH